MTRCVPRPTRALASLAVAFFAWIGSPLHANATHPADTDASTLDLVENFVAESRGGKPPAATTFVDECTGGMAAARYGTNLVRMDDRTMAQLPADLIQFHYEFCEARVGGCIDGCIGGARALIRSGLIRRGEGGAYVDSCLSRHCYDIMAACGYNNENEEDEEDEEDDNDSGN